MPVTRTATRALRKSKRKEERNKVVKARIKDVVREAKKIKSGKSETEKKEFLTKAYKVLDKAAKNNVIHENKAARLKSRVSEEMKQSEEKKVKTEKKKTTTKKKPKGKPLQSKVQ